MRRVFISEIIGGDRDLGQIVIRRARLVLVTKWVTVPRGRQNKHLENEKNVRLPDSYGE
jgi:hypothetical protein